SIGFGREIYLSRAYPSGLGVDEILERDRAHAAALEGDKRAASTVDEVANRAEAERSRVVHVEGYRLGAAEFVADILRMNDGVNSTVVERLANGVAENGAERNVRELHVAERIPAKMLVRTEDVVPNTLGDPFGHDRYAVPAPQRAPLDDRADDGVADRRER